MSGTVGSKILETVQENEPAHQGDGAAVKGDEAPPVRVGVGMSRSLRPDPAETVARTAIRGSTAVDGTRIVPGEVPIALTYNRTTYAVMLATPADLEDFAIGFSLSEGIIATPPEIEELEIVTVSEGIEARITLNPDRLDALTRRQRRLAGPSGCGLCGLDSLKDAVRTVERVTAAPLFTTAAIEAAMMALAPVQTLNHLTRAVHAAALWIPGRGLVAMREDIGRHNALDKLAGTLARSDISPDGGLVLLTSRVSVEMVQKAAAMGAPVIVAVSVPTALAIRVAEDAGITLIAVARQDGFEVFTCPHRISLRPAQHVA